MLFKCVEGMLPQRGGCKRGADAERERALSVRTGGALARAPAVREPPLCPARDQVCSGLPSPESPGAQRRTFSVPPCDPCTY